MGLILGFDHPDATSTSLVGGKGANLARLTQAGFVVPPGFCVRTDAYESFVAEHGLRERIAKILGELDPADPDQLQAHTAQIRNLVETSEMPGIIAEEIDAAYTALGADLLVAVRSSGTAEDLAEASFAGMHETYLDIRGSADVLDAVRRCWASLWTERATAYRATQGFDGASIGISVVIQTMVASEVSGVMFTGNPINTATDELLINASWGLGEAVVQGITTPDTFVVKHGDLRIRDKVLGTKELRIVRDHATGTGTVSEPVPQERRAVFSLSDGQAQDLAELGRRVQSYYEELPQDIEWALADGQFYLLQSRPVTGVEFAWDFDVDEWQTVPDNDEDYWSRTWADEAWTGAVSPLMYSWRSQNWDVSWNHFAKILGEEEGFSDIRWFKYYKGSAYTNLTKERVITERYAPPAFRGLGVWDHLPQAMLEATRKTPFSYARYLKVYAQLNLHHRADRIWGWRAYYTEYYLQKNLEFANGPATEDLRKLSDYELRKFIDRGKEFENKYNEEVWALTFVYTKDALCALMWVLRNWYDGDAASAYMDLLAGSGERTPTVIENRTLWELAQKLRHSPALLAAITHDQPSEFFTHLETFDEGREWLTLYRAFVNEYGHRGHADRDIYFPRRAEDPTVDFNTLRAYLDVCEDPTIREDAIAQRHQERKQEVLANVAQGSLGALRAEGLKVLLAWLENWTPWRDVERMYYDRSTFTMRRAFLEVNRRLLERGLVESDRDIWFLSVEELWLLLAGRAPHALTRAKIAARMRNFDRCLARDANLPMYLHKHQGVDLDAADADEGDGVLRGQAMSSGSITGTARVIKSQQELGDLNKGEILVCNATDPGWTAAFTIITGIVTETGGAMSHAACLAREYGLPAVQLPRAMQRVPDGATITIEGGSGRVTIHDEPPEPTAQPPEPTAQPAEPAEQPTAALTATAGQARR